MTQVVIYNNFNCAALNRKKLLMLICFSLKLYQCSLVFKVSFLYREYSQAMLVIEMTDEVRVVIVF